MRRKLKFFYGLVAPLCLLSACGVEQTELVCDVSFAEVEPSNLAVNVYVDGTPSMQGFTTSNAGSGQNAYAKTIEELRSLITLEEPVTLDGDRGRFAREPLFFRLGKHSDGQQSREISETEYREAAFADFYDGSNSAKFPYLEVLELDAAMKPIDDGDGLTIAITDLYQGENDIKAVTQAIKQVLDRSPDKAIGLLGIKGDFSGTVYTEPLRGAAQFQHSGLHPFYVLFIGRVDDVHFYTSKLISNLGSGVETQATIFSSSRFYTEPVTLNRKEQSDLIEVFDEDPEVRKQVSVPAAAMKAGDAVATFEARNIQPLTFRSGGMDAIAIQSSSALTPISHILQTESLNANISATSSKGEEAFTQSGNASVFALNNVTVEGDTLQYEAQFSIDNMSDSEIQFIQADLLPASRLSTDSWWNEWSAGIGENDGTRTNNLSEFANQLRSITSARIDQNAPLAGRLCYAVGKQ